MHLYLMGLFESQGLSGTQINIKQGTDSMYNVLINSSLCLQCVTWEHK